MAFKMKGSHHYGKNPLKHALPDGEAHVHGTNKSASFDTDTEEKNFTRRDRKTYVRTKKSKRRKNKVEKSDNYDMIRGNTSNKKPKKKKDTWYRDSDNDGTVVSRGLKKAGKWAKKNIDLKGAFFWESGGGPSRKSSSAFWHKGDK